MELRASSLDLMLDRKNIGTLHWEEHQDGIYISASCPFESGFIYRVSLQSASLAPLRLGVMLPQKGRFILQKQLPKDKKKVLCGRCTASIDRRMPNETEMLPLPFVFSKLHVASIDELPKDNLLRSCFSAQSGGLCADYMDEKYLVFPFKPGTECGFSGLFCLSTPIIYNNSTYVALRIGASGEILPILSNT